ncbi:SUKH-4 family immunity protein [Paenibacillus xylanexedens]|uniref:SUKH-4 family immunity protein n=1 Tax=Paenibacillus xylanexedens TaxID=528191 RepID=UPI0021B608FF|nr:SUKH-4 family immunity protein [Paenibacillus xylanexedens]
MFNMDFDIRQIRDYYDTQLHEYDYKQLLSLGVSRHNAEFMIEIGIPAQFDIFVFYDLVHFQKCTIDGESFIQIGHYSFSQYGLYLKEGSNELYASSFFHEPHVYKLNQDMKTFFLFHLVRNEVAMQMRQEGQYTTYNYADELREMFKELDPIAMNDVEGYWSHLIEDYETGL